MNKVNMAFIFLVINMLFACSGKKGGNPQPQPDPKPQPVHALLLLPLQNEVCANGANQTATQSTVTLDWSDADKADSYVVEIKNLLTNTTQEVPSTASTVNVTLARATPFSWYVISKSSKSDLTAQSDTWKFYNSGEGVISYAPFPATLLSPTLGQEVKMAGDSVTLKWSSSDADGDLASYDVYFGTGSAPSLIGTNTPDKQTQNVKVVINTIYYWKIVTKDAKGNTSDSGINQFKTN